MSGAKLVVVGIRKCGRATRFRYKAKHDAKRKDVESTDVYSANSWRLNDSSVDVNESPTRCATSDWGLGSVTRLRSQRASKEITGGKGE